MKINVIGGKMEQKEISGDILAIPPEQRDNNSGGSPYVP